MAGYTEVCGGTRRALAVGLLAAALGAASAQGPAAGGKSDKDFSFERLFLEGAKKRAWAGQKLSQLDDAVLFRESARLMKKALDHYQDRKFTLALQTALEELALTRKRLPPGRFKDGHLELVNSLRLVALVLSAS